MDNEEIVSKFHFSFLFITVYRTDDEHKQNLFASVQSHSD